MPKNTINKNSAAPVTISTFSEKRAMMEITGTITITANTQLVIEAR
jgi:hypothetical protein